MNQKPRAIKFIKLAIECWQHRPSARPQIDRVADRIENIMRDDSKETSSAKPDDSEAESCDQKQIT